MDLTLLELSNRKTLALCDKIEAFTALRRARRDSTSTEVSLKRLETVYEGMTEKYDETILALTSYEMKREKEANPQ